MVVRKGGVVADDSYDYELRSTRHREPATRSDIDDVLYSVKQARKEIEELREHLRGTNKTLGEIYRRTELAIVFSALAVLGIALHSCS